MPAAARPVARLTSPGEIAAVVPVLCGFVPRESLVAVSLRGPRSRVGLTMRFDLDWAAAAPAAAAAEVAARLARDGARRAVLVVLSERGEAGAGDPLAWSDLVEDVEQACAAEGVAVSEALLVRDGRWWSYACREPACCPPGGTPVTEPQTPALRLLQAERVLDGRAVLASREELTASVAPPTLLAAQAAQREVAGALTEWLDRGHRDGPQALRTHGVHLARSLVERGPAEVVTGPEAARLAVAVQDLAVRDEVATWCLDRPEAVLPVLQQTARLVVPPEDAAVLALLAWVAYALGDGGLANVALERCLRSDPDHPLAGLLGEMLHRQVAPSEVRRLLLSTRTRRGR